MQVGKITLSTARPFDVLWQQPAYGMAVFSSKIVVSPCAESAPSAPLYAQIESAAAERAGRDFLRLSPFEVSINAPGHAGVCFLGLSREGMPKFIGATQSSVYWADSMNFFVTDYRGKLIFTTIGSGLSWDIRTVIADDYHGTIRIDAASGRARLVMQLENLTPARPRYFQGCEEEIKITFWDGFSGRPRLPPWIFSAPAMGASSASVRTRCRTLGKYAANSESDYEPESDDGRRSNSPASANCGTDRE